MIMFVAHSTVEPKMYLPRKRMWWLSRSYWKSYLDLYSVEEAAHWKSEKGAKRSLKKHLDKLYASATSSLTSNSYDASHLDIKNWVIEEVSDIVKTPVVIPEYAEATDHQRIYRLQKWKRDLYEKHGNWYCVSCKNLIPKNMLAMKMCGTSAYCALCLSDIGDKAKASIKKIDKAIIDRMISNHLVGSL